MKIYLVGYMYSGKTTIGRQLAQALGVPFVDTDQAFEQRFRTSIPLFFNRYGEEAFRLLERQVLHSTATLPPAVISTGGGTPCQFDNMQWINNHGLSVYLEVSLPTLLERAATSRKQRPTLAAMSPDEREQFITRQITDRMPYYRQASIHFAADHPNLDNLLTLLRET